MLGEWYLPPGKCQAISTITEGIISISHPAPLSSQTRIPQTSSPLVDKSQATQAALLQIRRSEPAAGDLAVAQPTTAIFARLVRAPELTGDQIGAEQSEQLDYRPASLFVAEHDH